MKEDIYLKNGRNKSSLITMFQRKTGTTIETLANSIGVSVDTFRVKLNRDSFSWEQMNDIIHACGYEIEFKRLTVC